MQKEDLQFSKKFIKRSKYSRFQDFRDLMQFRVRDILLVSSLYDSYIFEEDGRLYELVRKEYHGLNLSNPPELVQVSSGKKAIELAKEEKRFNLIIVTLHIENMKTTDFVKKIKALGITTPIVLLGYDNIEMIELISSKDVDLFDKVFIWQGDYRIILGIVKFIEDKMNIKNDTAKVGVQVILLIEDDVRFYSYYLPIIYTEILKQSQNLISEGINLSHKFLRMRARPKIILCSTYEEANYYYSKYKEFILGIISDVDFKRKGIKNPKAGFLFTKKIKKKFPDVPILIQSNLQENAVLARKIGASFLLKDSPTLLTDLRKFMKENFSFGDFIFRNSKGEEVGRARNLAELETGLENVPGESLVYHASRNHFSNWLKARTEFGLAYKLRPQKVSDFSSPEELREYLISAIVKFRQVRQRAVISDFNPHNFDSQITIARIGGGSLGGKAHGLGFVNYLLSNFELRNKFKDIEIAIPSAVILGTEIFDSFLEENNLREFALKCKDDVELDKRFINADKFPTEALENLSIFLLMIHTPLAVRSSSLLEDSQGQPFAGVYDTFMIPNNHPDLDIRLYQLMNSIKLVYASTFHRKTKDYMKMTTYRLEEEKMAVIVQKLVGSEHNGKFYPEFSGVARSYNFYPVYPLAASDGIVSVGLGLGKIITDGGNVLRFCPKYPNHLMQFATVDDILKYSQKNFFALDLTQTKNKAHIIEDDLIKSYEIGAADADGTFFMTGSTYSVENDVIYDGISRKGVRLFTLAPILKYKTFPLPEIIELILKMGEWGMGSPVEIEFAVNLSTPEDRPKEFSLLQLRPLVINNELVELNVDDYPKNEIICKSKNALGNGVVDNIYDIIMVDRLKFERSKSREVALEIAQYNSLLLHEKRHYLLIGVGRWGSLDPWLGIPVTWEQICGAKTIIEANFKDFNVTPSQGSHFFQNLTSFKVGYFSVDSYRNEGFIDWDWLAKQTPVSKKAFTRHIHFKQPVIVKINGQENKGIILKPGNT